MRAAPGLGVRRLEPHLTASVPPRTSMTLLASLSRAASRQFYL